ncbi:MAG: 2-oxoglutarate and iron-dependent oxygenase domain-containing protein, partial [Bacteroidota bacterium]
MSSNSRTIPLVNLSHFVDGDEASRQAFIKQLGDAFHGIGFVGVTGHGIPKSLIDGFFAAAKAFFALDTDT